MLVLFLVAGIGIAAALALNAFQKNLLFFYSPTQIVNGEASTERVFRMGGMVVDGSLQRDPDGLKVEFQVTDTAEVVPVVYSGILPDLFREGQGIVALGRLDNDGTFVAEQVLAKHDEEYMPPEAGDAVKAAQRARATVLKDGDG
jgi:cytochrome c-type biogenesis protein CcmE